MKVPFLDLKRQYEQIKGEVEPAVKEVLESCSYIGGSFVSIFEAEIAEYLGVKHAVCCANGTDALVLALRACNVQPGDEVITSPFTFFATAEAIASIQAVPVFVDICEDTFNIDVSKIEEKITYKTKVILPVHIFGMPCDMNPIKEVADKYGLKVIEDAAQSIGSQYEGVKAGGLGDIACFSFYPTKNLGAFGDGGMVTTNSDELAVILRALKEHGAGESGATARALLYGIQDEFTESKTNQNPLYNPYKYYNYIIGYNSRLDAVQAAVLSIKLKCLDEFNKRRFEIAGKYSSALNELVSVPLYDVSYKATTCFHQYVIKTPLKDELIDFLAKKGISAGTFYPVPLHLQKAFQYLYYKEGSLPVSEKMAKQTVCLPIYPELHDDEVEYVIQSVKDFFETVGNEDE